MNELPHLQTWWGVVAIDLGGGVEPEERRLTLRKIAVDVGRRRDVVGDVEGRVRVRRRRPSAGRGEERPGPPGGGGEGQEHGGGGEGRQADPHGWVGCFVFVRLALDDLFPPFLKLFVF